MLILHDPAAGGPTPVTPTRRGELRTYAAGPRAAGRPGPGTLRSLLLADLIRRVAERQQLTVTAWQSCDAGPAGEGTDGHGTGGHGTGGSGTATGQDDWCGMLREDGRALNIYPAEFTGTVPGWFDVGIALPAGGHTGAAPSAGSGPPGAGPAPGGRRARWVRPAVAVLTGDLTRRGGAGAPLTAGLGHDPLALRLALLRHHYRQPVTVDAQALRAADAELHSWRQRVAEWATEPSRPMCADYTAGITAAFEADLDIPGALRTMSALTADPQIPPGSKFESFAHLDRVLGLDLARDVGR